MSPILTMQGIEKRFGSTQALGGVDLQVSPGEVLALVGENGAGKSTLMKVLSGAHRPDAGTMTLGGQTYAPLHPLQARRLGVAMIYQELSLAPHLSVAENILLGVEPQVAGFLKRRAMRETALDALARVGLEEIAPETPVARLSVAQRQMVEIARALAQQSRVLVLDEPTSSLARADVLRLFEMVRQLRAAGQAIIYITHFLEEVRELADRFTVLRDGRSVGSGIPAHVSNADMVALMVGRSVAELYPRSPRQPGEVLLEVTQLAGQQKPHNCSLQLHRGEVLGIAGLVGAGRTELLRCLMGLDAIRSGAVSVASHTGRALPSRRWQQGMGMVSEDRKTEGLALDLSIEENLTLTRVPRFFGPARLQFLAGLQADRLGVKRHSVRQRVGELSGGNQQKVALARLLHHECDVLLLDEPTRGVDVGSKAEIYRIIDQLAQEGKGVLMVSSYLPELLGTCDRICVMHRGVLGPARPVQDVTEHSIMLEATGGNAQLN